VPVQFKYDYTIVVVMEHLFYSKLAKYYDKIYHYVDYKKQVDFFVRIIKKYNKSKNNKILDVACGTGVHVDLLKKQGFDIVGVDISNEMLKEAKKKNSDVQLLLGDMKNLKVNEKFGTIIIFFNSILYNKNKEELKKTTQNFYDHLDTGGILIFDTVDKSIGINSKPEKGYEYHDDNLNIKFIPQWIFDKENNVLDLEIDFIVNKEKLHDHHVMGAFSFQELKNLIEEIGFKVMIMKKDYRESEPYTTDTTAIFLCEKP